MGTRIQQLIDALGIKKAEFSRQINLSQPFVSELCSGAKNPSDRTISDICREFNVNEAWLRHGTPPMFRESIRDDQIKTFFDRVMQGESDDFRRRLVSVLSRLGENEWEALEQRLREILAENPDGQEEAAAPGGGDGLVPVVVADAGAVSAGPPPEQPAAHMPKARRSGPMVQIKVYEQPAAAGLGNYLEEPDYRVEQYPPKVIPAKTDFGVIISGDSMEPKIHDGGTVFVQAIPAIDPGQIGIFVLDGKAFCKKLMVDQGSRRIHLVSLNPKYEDIIVDEDSGSFRTLGRVLGQWTPGYKQDLLGW